MSEHGWRTFLAAGLDDWVVLHGGPAAVYRVATIRDGAALVAALADLPGMDTRRTAVTLTSGTVSVRLTRDLWQLEPGDVTLAREVSRVAAGLGARADREAVQEVQLAVASRPDEADLPFWRAVLGYESAAQDNAVDPLAHGSTVWLQELDPARPLRHAMHVDVSVARKVALRRVTAAVAAGGRVVADADAPDHWILADRAGNRVCVAAWPDGARQSTST